MEIYLDKKKAVIFKEVLQFSWRSGFAGQTGRPKDDRQKPQKTKGVQKLRKLVR